MKGKYLPKTNEIVLSEAEVSKGCVTVFKLYAWAIHVQRNNVGGFTDPYGHKVHFGVRGQCDFMGMFRNYGGPWDGKMFGLEIKRGDFNPARISGVKNKEHWARQMATMININESGGVAFWVRDSTQLSMVLPKILAGAKIVFDTDGFPYLDLR